MTAPSVGGALLAAAAVAFSAVPVAGQEWTAEARFGQLEFRLSPTGAPPATTIALGLGLAHRDRRFGLSAGVPMGEEDPLWGAADLRDRAAVDLGAVTLGLDAATQAFGQRYTQSVQTPGGPFEPPTLAEEPAYGWGLAAQALPFVAAGKGAVRVEARAGGSFYRTSLDGASVTRNVGLGDIRMTLAASPAFALTAEARHFVAEEGSWTFAGAGALLVAGPELDLWATAGRWLNDEVETVPWTLGAAWRLQDRFDLILDARQDALDPLYGSAPRRAWSVALRVRLSEPVAPAEPVPAAYDGVTATIALPAGAAGESPRIAGDFNDWTPEPMVRRGDAWEWRGALEPGVYEYAFVNGDGDWFVPASVPGRKDDGMGGWVALLVVEEPER